MTIRWKKILWGTAGTLIALFPAFLMAHYDGPDVRHTGAPGDIVNSCATTQCHTNPTLTVGGPVNAYGGNVTATAKTGGVAANVIHGDVRTGPTRPGQVSS